MTNFMSCLEGMDVYSDQDVASKVVKAVTDVYMENWNTGSLEEFVEALTSVKNEVESIRDDSVSGELVVQEYLDNPQALIEEAAEIYKNMNCLD